MGRQDAHKKRVRSVIERVCHDTVTGLILVTSPSGPVVAIPAAAAICTGGLVGSRICIRHRLIVIDKHIQRIVLIEYEWVSAVWV